MIAILIGRLDASRTLIMDTWLMSCRVLGRQVEEACLNVIAEAARHLGAHRILGEYIPTAKNSMVAELYPRLGFEPLSFQTPDTPATTHESVVESTESAARSWQLDLTIFQPKPVSMSISTTAIAVSEPVLS